MTFRNHRSIMYIGVGRTGRGNQKGQALSFCSKEEKELLSEIEDNLGKPIQRLEISKKEYTYTLERQEKSTDEATDWQTLLTEADAEELVWKKKKRKKK